jgi:hypothetical protein
MLKQKIKTEWLILGAFLAVAFLLGVKGVYAYLDIISFTGGNYNVGSEIHSICPDIINVSGDKLDNCTGLRWKASDEVNGTCNTTTHICNNSTKQTCNNNNDCGINWYQAAGVYNSTYNSPVINKCPNGYRLPTIEELYSLANLKSFSTNTNSSPLIVPSNIALGTYWSVTDYKPNTNYARSVYFWQRTADNIIFSKSMGLNVRCISTTVCGDGVLDTASEKCDGKNFGGATCQSEGSFKGGILSCSQCQIKTDGCFNTVIKPTMVGLSCNNVCEQYKINDKGIVCSSNNTTCKNSDGSDAAALTCKSIGTYQGYCGTTNNLCNTNSDCSVGVACLIGVADKLLNSAWKQSVLSGTNFECKNIKGYCSTDSTKPCFNDGDCGGVSGSCAITPVADLCGRTMGGYGDVCDGRKTPWAYCQCGI